MTHAIFFRRPGRPGLVLVAGVLAGIGLWTNPLIVVFCVPFAPPRSPDGPRVAGVRLALPARRPAGGLPDWIYDVVNYPSAKLLVGQSGSVPAEALATRLRLFLGEITTEAVRRVVRGGVRPATDRPGRSRRAGRPLHCPRRGPGPGGAPMCWSAAVARPTRGSSCSGACSRRTSWPCFAFEAPAGSQLSWCPSTGSCRSGRAECLWWLSGFRRWLGGLALAALLAFHLWAHWAVTLGRSPHPTWRWTPVHAITRPLTDWLVARGIRRVYWAPDGVVPAFEFSHLTGMRVIAAHIWAEDVIQHAHAVDAVDSPPIVTTANRLAPLQASLRGLGLDFRETGRRGFRGARALPIPARGFARRCRRPGWTLTASHRAHELHHLLDRDAGTGWSTGQLQTPGQWLQVDLGQMEEVARVDLLAIDWKEVPAGIRVETSTDGASWHAAVSVPDYWGPIFWSERHAFLRVRRGRVS